MPLNLGASTPKTPLVSKQNAGYTCHMLTAAQRFLCSVLTYVRRYFRRYGSTRRELFHATRLQQWLTRFHRSTLPATSST